jgi:transposase
MTTLRARCAVCSAVRDLAELVRDGDRWRCTAHEAPHATETTVPNITASSSPPTPGRIHTPRPRRHGRLVKRSRR